jgi:hypothetical protein
VETNNNYFCALNAINVNDKTEKKNGLTYLSWAYAWGETKKLFPDAFYTIYENDAGWFYHTDGKTCWVKTGVTVNGLEHIEYLPVMDHRNNSIALERVTSFDVNKAIQRSLTKALARHGLGLYIYAGEDLPDDEREAKEPASGFKKADVINNPGEPTETFFCDLCGKVVEATKKRDGSMWLPKDMVAYSRLKFDGKCLCAACMKQENKK